MENEKSNIPSNAYLMIIGAMKSGTTSLFCYLRNHPEICPCSVVEPEFFSTNQAHKTHVDSYRELWNFDSSKHKYCLEASTGYTKFPEEKNVSERIFSTGIKPKFIYLVRNPFERIESEFNFKKFILKQDFEFNITDNSILDQSRYNSQLLEFLKYFNFNDIHVVDFEVLRSDPASVLRGIYSFTGLSSHFLPHEYLIHNKTFMYDSMSFPSKINMKIRSFLRGNKVISSKNKIKLTKEEYAWVYKELREDIIEFGKVFNFNVKQWGF